MQQENSNRLHNPDKKNNHTDEKMEEGYIQPDSTLRRMLDKAVRTVSEALDSTKQDPNK
jgi:hypothetical protein